MIDAENVKELIDALVEILPEMYAGDFSRAVDFDITDSAGNSLGDRFHVEFLSYNENGKLGYPRVRLRVMDPVYSPLDEAV